MITVYADPWGSHAYLEDGVPLGSNGLNSKIGSLIV
jgi:hypothetical protein